ncbi:MAG: hypothetical protein ACI88H_001132 [Cocleimonas sp.]|jgi:hypothetical protein
MNFKTIRITLLLLVLAYIGIDTFLSDERATDWKRSLRVVVYPINGDGSVEAEEYIKQLQSSHFDSINALLEMQSIKFNINLQEPLRISLAPIIESLPPKIPDARTGLKVLWWSIKLRFWAWQKDNFSGPKPQVKAYALYYNPQTHNTLKHSTGLKKAKLAINYLFASTKKTEQNNIVLLHEILHTLGATDKYDLSNGLPNFPEGYADRNKQPLYPQTKAEIMGGRVPLSKSQAKIPISLKSVEIGSKTAKEIGWIE